MADLEIGYQSDRSSTSGSCWHGSTRVSGDYSQPSTDSFTVPAKSVGATFGLGFNQATGTLYASSYTKRFAGYGPNAAGTGTTDGAIYAINPTTGAVSVLADLNTIFGANTGGVDFRSLVGWTGYSTDGGNTGWNSVGETSLGGLAVSPDGSTVYVMNLADRSIYSIPTSGPINSTTVHRMSIPFNAPGATGTLGGTVAGDLRPFAVTYADGQLYVGIVNSAQSTQNKADLQAYVYTVNPTTLAFSSSPVFQTSLDYPRGNAANFGGSGNPSADWNPWSSTFQTLGMNTTATYPQPMLSGITFDANGDMILGIRDRDGDQTGFFTNANPANPTQTYEGIAAGDTLMAFANTAGSVTSGWTLETDGRGPSGQGTGTQNTATGPGGAEFYYQQNYSTSHSNVASGGVYELPGFNDVITSTFDPGTTTVRTGGIRFLNNTTGATDKGYQIYNTGFNAPPQSTFGKAAGIGDVTGDTGLAPIEIGDRVFLDLNDDGIQDPSDPGVAGVTVHLYQGTTLVGTTVTNSTGNYLFNASDVPGGLLPNTAYQVRFDNAADFTTGGALVGKVVSKANQDPSGLSDSKVTLVNGVPVISVTTGGAGINDLNLDAGFVSTGSVSGTVFNDANNNGVDNAEPGIPNVTLTLTGTNDLGVTISVTTTTDANGNYTFSGLRPSGAGGYTITETLPTGYLIGKDAAGTLGGTATANSTVIQTIGVAPGVTGTGYTFGNLLPSTLAGFAYSDSDDNGVKETGELGIPGVTITLTGTNDQGAPVSLTTTTLGDGSYSFTNLRPGTYAITETQPAAYLDGKDTIGTPGGTTGADTFTGIVLASGVNGANNNFGELLPASLTGFVYLDANDNGIIDSTELGIPGVTVKLTGTNDLGVAVSLMTTTTSTGSYSFGNLRPSTGGYTIAETLPAGYLTGTDEAGTEGGTPGTNTIVTNALGAGVNGTSNNFGNLQPSTLAGFVYVDSSDDGIKQAGEAGITGVMITLTGTNDQGTPISLTTTTGAGGAYSFVALRPGTYALTETQPVNYLQGKDTIGTPGGTTGVDTFSGIALTSGFNGANNNFGELQAASLSGFVYIDANADGRKQTTEPGIAGVTVTLTGTNDLGNPVNLSTLTDSTGAYTFANLRPSGSAGYTVTDVPPSGYTIETNTVGTSGGTLNGQNSVTQIGIISGATATRYFFGYTGATISGTAFVDANDDGIDDNGEAGLGGVTITLTNTVTMTSVTTTTAANGTYSFTNLPAGSYTVVETPPTGYGSSTLLSDPITIGTAGQSGVNFGSTTSSLSGLVFTDVNDNGIYDPGTDTVGAGDTVSLTGTDVNGKTVTLTTTTTANGTFSFTGLIESNSAGYTVTATIPGDTDGTAIVGSVGGLSTAANDTVSTIVLGAGTSAINYQFPAIGTIIQGEVFVDSNANGTLDPGEVGVANVMITLSSPSLTDPITIDTLADGSYTFPGLSAGTYTITESVPAGYGTTTTTVLSNLIITAAGVDNENFGLTASSLSGTVYNDLNDPTDTGTLKAGDPGIAGITITLLNGSNVQVATTTTAADGTYSFPNIPGGSYTIVEGPVTAYNEGPVNAGTAGGTPNANDTISAITLPNNTAATGYNFGERGASISGEVYLDANDNNMLDTGEAGLGGVTIQLLSGGVVIATTVTAADGTYSFNNLPAGTYSTHEDRPNGYGSSASTNVTITLGTGGDSGNNYGLTTGSISGETYLDLNDDGAPDVGDPPIAGVTITLIGTDANGQSVIETTTTNAAGDYTFTGLLAGTYSIAEAQPTAYRIGQASAGTSGGTVGTDLIVGIGLGAAINATAYNFGSLGYPVSGTVFLDANDDGFQEPGEAGLAGVPLTLTLVNSMNQVVATTTSTANGTYTFPNVVAGSYNIVETPPLGYGTSTPTSIPVTVTSAGVVDENFGVTTSSISGTAFLDVNKDNAYTPGVDVPAAGLPVTLTGTDINGKPVDLTTTVAADGSFTFTGLLEGTYSVFTTPYPGVNQQPVVLGTINGATTGFGTVTGLDDVTSIILPAGTAAIGYLFPGTGVVVSGTVYNDANGDKMFDGTDVGVPGVTVTLTGLNINTGMPVTLTTTTDANGNYVFPTAVAEEGTLTIVLPANTAADTPTSITTSIPATGLTGQNFGLTTGSIGGTVFADSNDDGIQEAMDSPIANVILLLTGTDTGGHMVSLSTITAANGSYLFSGLNPGTYTVTEIPPTGYLSGIETVGSTTGATGPSDINTITVATGEASTGNNFAELVPSSLAGTVYIDANDNGNKETGELGILGVTVTLTGLDDLGDLVNLTTTTLASGNYSFTNLRPGDYTITETPPAGYLEGTDNVGTQGGTLVARTITGIALTPGIAGGSNNFAELVPGTVSGSVFVDANDNRVDDPGEPGIAGVTVTLTGTNDLGQTITLTTTTGADGTYSFTGLRPSDTNGYTVTETAPVGYLPGLEDSTSLTDDRVFSDIVLSSGQTDGGIGFPELIPASLSGYVYQDLNDGGAKGLNEPGIAGVTVTLSGYDDEQDPVLLTATTDANGFYSFTNLRPALEDLQYGLVTGYTITETQPAGYLDGKDKIGTPGGVTGNDVFSQIPVVSGTAGVNNDFGELPPASLSGFVYVDANDDGIKQLGEAGIAGTTVTLTGLDDLGDLVNLTTTTAADGSYSFTNLRPSGVGGYILTETQPTAYLDGKDTIGSENGLTANDTFSDLVLTAGAVGINNNFGELQPAVLSGFAYLDANDNGIKDPADAGLAGITITLTGVNDLGALVHLTTTTAADGSYSFGNLRPSNIAGYTLTETPPAGYFNGVDGVGPVGGTVGTDTLTGLVVTSGLSGPGNNFASIAMSSLSGTVYLDLNKAGVLEVGDPGLAGVTVTLTGTDVNGNPVKTYTTTAADGTYSFTGLLPGTYTVSDVLDPDYVEGVTVAGSASGTVAGNVVSGIHLGSGVAATAYNFGETGVSISGTVYNDTNGDGKPETGEPGEGGVTITLLNGQGQVVATTTTAPDGTYSFANLPTDSFTIVETLPNGMMATTPTSLAVCCCSTTTGLTGENFGLDSNASLSGFVYADKNDDGAFEPGEMGLAGATVTLTGTTTLGQSVTLTTTTGANGSYSFTGLLPGTYTVGGSPVAGYGDGLDASGSAGGTVIAGDKIGTVVLGSGVAGVNYDFGKIGATLTGTVMVNGSPAAGATVVVGSGGQIFGVTTTGPDGTYSIPGLPAVPVLVQATIPVPSGSPQIQTNVAILTPTTPTASNFSVATPTSASIAGYVYDDLYDARFRGGADPGIAGVLVSLGGTDAQGNFIFRQEITGPDGSYDFTNLPVGTYTLLEGTAAGYLDGGVSAGTLGGTTASHLIQNIALTNGASGVEYDFGHLVPSVITGTVYIDANKNGVLDNEFGLAHIPVTLQGHDLQGNAVDLSTTTQADGTYDFTDLAPGIYQVTVDRLTQYFNSGANNPGSAGGTSNLNTIGMVPLAAGTVDSGYNFGEVIRKGCVLNLPSVLPLVQYGPHPDGVPSSLVKGINIVAGSPTAYYVPTLVSEIATTRSNSVAQTQVVHKSSVVSVPVVKTGKAHPSTVSHKSKHSTRKK